MSPANDDTNEHQNSGTRMNLFFTVLGAVQLIIGAICLVALKFLFTHGIYPQDLTVLYFQMACISAGGIAILLGLETLFLSSRQKRGVRNALIFDIIISIVMGIIIINTAKDFDAVYLGEEIFESDLELWDKDVLSYYKMCAFLGNIAAILFFVSVLLLLFLLFKNITAKE